MLEPDFGEAQLQQCVNTEITNRLLLSGNVFVLAVVLTLPEEAILGWDSAFYLPWLANAPSQVHRGCNFFIQYKLSVLYEGISATQYDCWDEPYFRFKIPHTMKSGKRYVSDYHQFEALRKLANAHYPVFYATNHVLLREELFQLAADRRLLDEIPLLDVAPLRKHHRFVTFTEASHHFLLHSDPKKFGKANAEIVEAQLKQHRSTALAEDNETTFALLSESIAELPGSERVREGYLALDRQQTERGTAVFRQFHLLRRAFRRFLGVEMFRRADPLEADFHRWIEI
jgi:hypothetical protein